MIGKKLFKLIGLGLVFCAIPFSFFGQSFGDIIQDESTLYAETKQVNQFFRRFNNEEDAKGERFVVSDEAYRNNFIRAQFIPQLFDLEKYERNNPLLTSFVKQVSDESNPFYLNFNEDAWFAELVTDFEYNGKTVWLNLFLRLVKAEQGTKWIIENIYFEPFLQALPGNEKDPVKFLHPLSHELDFMNISKVFRDPETVENYTHNTHQPDYLSIFLYELKNSLLCT